MKRIYELLPKKVAEKIRSSLEFRGGTQDTYLFRATSEPSKWDDRRQYRYPPGSQKPARVPDREEENRFDIKYFPRDTIRHANPLESRFTSDDNVRQISSQKPLLLQQMKDLSGSRGSPIRSNPAVERYSTDGLRSAMTASHEATQNALLEKQPDHLPTPEYYVYDDGTGILNHHDEKNLPPTPGRPTQWRKDPHHFLGREKTF